MSRKSMKHRGDEASVRLMIGPVLLVLGLMAITAGSLNAQNNGANWPNFGQNASNTAYNPSENTLSTKNVYQLKAKWTYTTSGDVSARAAVVNGIVYFPDWGGNITAVNASSGKMMWAHQLTDYLGLSPTGGAIHSRTSPAVVDGVLYLGTQEEAQLLAINASTGSLLWHIALGNGDPYAIVTTSPVVSNGVVYTGVASVVEGGSIFGYNISSSSSRGSVVAVNASTRAVSWQTYTIPTGYYGGGVWGSNPVIDTARNTLYIGTGHNYLNPQSSAESSVGEESFGECISAGGSPASCNSPNDHEDSILALDLTTGAIKWSLRLVNWSVSPYDAAYASGSDDWNVDCAFGGPQCPDTDAGDPGPDFDFGSAPNEITYQTANGSKTIIGAGQKSGIYYALDPDTGNVLWETAVGPGSSLGGMEWGSASDGKRIYVAIANLYGIPYGAGNAGSCLHSIPPRERFCGRRRIPMGRLTSGL